jgi:hypothetical protein
MLAEQFIGCYVRRKRLRKRLRLVGVNMGVGALKSS